MEVLLLIIAAGCIFVVFYRPRAKQRAESHAAQPSAILEQVSQDLEDIKVPPPRPQPTLPSKAIFVDVETTGLTASAPEKVLTSAYTDGRWYGAPIDKIALAINEPTLPSKVVFVDVETTGLTDSDRIVSFAAILLDTQSLKTGDFTVSVIHVVCDPGKKSHPRAASVHGFSDWVLRHQDPFSKYAGEIELLLGKADLIVAHNANFDMNFINRELGSELINFAAARRQS
jgi:DNA polymerase III epsilon subunit-like protein